MSYTRATASGLTRINASRVRVQDDAVEDELWAQDADFDNLWMDGVKVTGIDTDSTMAADSDYNLVTQKAAAAHTAAAVSAHAGSDGSSHTFIDQAVTKASTPQFAAGTTIGRDTAISYALEINDTLGKCLRLIRDSATGAITKYVDFRIDSAQFCILPTAADTEFTGILRSTGAMFNTAMTMAGTVHTTLIEDIDPDYSLSVDSDARLPTQKAVKAYVDQQLGLGKSNGFLDNTNSTLSWADGNRRLTYTPSSDPDIVLSNGFQYPKPVTPMTIDISDVDGTHYVYIDLNGALAETTTWRDTLITDDCLVAAPYWNVTAATAPYVGDERHGLTMDGSTHLALHASNGTIYQSGIALGDFTIGTGADNADYQFTSSVGSIIDEDIVHAIPVRTDKTAVSIPVFYKIGASGYWRMELSDTCGLFGSLMQYNSSGTWAKTDLGNLKFGFGHMFANNDITPANRLMCVMGQAEYATLNAAKAAAPTAISDLITAGLPFVEFVAIGTIIFQTSSGGGYTNAKKCKIVEISTGVNYIDHRTSGLTAGGSATITEHGNLPGLLDDDHSQYVMTVGRAAEDVTMQQNAFIAGSLAIARDAATNSSIEVNHASGDCMRLMYGTSTGVPTYYADIGVASNGRFDIDPSSGFGRFNGQLGILKSLPSYGIDIDVSTISGNGMRFISGADQVIWSMTAGVLNHTSSAGLSRYQNALVVGSASLTGDRGNFRAVEADGSCMTLTRTTGGTDNCDLYMDADGDLNLSLDNGNNFTFNKPIIGTDLTLTGTATLPSQTYPGTSVIDYSFGTTVDAQWYLIATIEENLGMYIELDLKCVLYGTNPDRYVCEIELNMFALTTTPTASHRFIDSSGIGSGLRPQLVIYHDGTSAYKILVKTPATNKGLWGNIRLPNDANSVFGWATASDPSGEGAWSLKYDTDDIINFPPNAVFESGQSSLYGNLYLNNLATDAPSLVDDFVYRSIQTKCRDAGGSTRTAARIQFIRDGAAEATKTPSKITFQTYTQGGSIGDRLTIRHDGVLEATCDTEASSSTVGALTLAGGLAVAKKVYVGTGVYLPSGTPSELNYYEEGTHSTTWTCTGWAAPTAGNIPYTRVGNKVTLMLPYVTASGDGTAGSLITSTTVLPVPLRPVAAIVQPALVVDNGVAVFGRLGVDVTGSVSWTADVLGAAFASTTNALAFHPTSVTYTVA